MATKSIHRREYAVLLKLLRTVRDEAKVTQVQFALAIGRNQSFVSNIERGSRRIDVIQLRDMCAALKTTLPQFVARLERELGSAPERSIRSRRQASR